MGQGYTRNDTTNNIANGNVISAADLDGEFDAIVAAFVNTTGHTHDGTAEEGGAVSVIGPVQEYLGDGTAFYPKTTAVYTLGKASNVWANLHLVTLTLSGTATMATVDINGGNIDNTVIGATTPVAGTFSTLKSIAADGLGTVNIVSTTNSVSSGNKIAFFAANRSTTDEEMAYIKPLLVANNGGAGNVQSGDLAFGTTGVERMRIGSTGVVAITTADINGGTIDGTSIGAAARSTGAFTTVNSSGLTTVASLLATTADINGGTIDGTVIGGTTPAAGTFATSLTVEGPTGNLYLKDTDVGSQSTITQTGQNLFIDNESTTGGDTFFRTDNGKIRLVIRDTGDIEFRDTLGTSIDFSWDASAGLLTVPSLTATTADINGGNIDGTIIGSTTRAAGSFDSLNVARTSAGFGSIEVGGSLGALIDLKAPFSDDFDARIQYNAGANLTLNTLANEPINLSHQGTTRLATSSTGISVTGNIVGTGDITTTNSKLSVRGADLGTALNNTVETLSLRSDTSNVDRLSFYAKRNAAGTTWTTAGQRIQRYVDAVAMGYIQFGSNVDDLITFGESGSTEHMRIDGSGRVSVGSSVTAGSGRFGSLVSGRSTYGGTANAITVTTGTGIAALVAGMEIRFRATAANTGGTTINVDGLGVATAWTVTGVALPASYIRTDVDTVARYNGTQWVCSRAVEFGSNANGKYTRWEDSRQVCYYNGSVALVSLTYVRTYAAAFNELPAVWGHCTQQNLDGTSSDARNIVYMTPHAGFASGGHSTTQWDMMAKATQSGATQCITTASINVQFGAVGTWY